MSSMLKNTPYVNLTTKVHSPQLVQFSLLRSSKSTFLLLRDAWLVWYKERAYQRTLFLHFTFGCKASYKHLVCNQCYCTSILSLRKKKCCRQLMQIQKRPIKRNIRQKIGSSYFDRTLTRTLNNAFLIVLSGNTYLWKLLPIILKLT